MNYQKASRDRHLSRQPIVNSKSKTVSDFTPTLRRKVMRFGKYKNYEFRSLPDDYLRWCILNIEDEHLLDDLVIELKRRDPSFCDLSVKKTKKGP